MGVGVEVGVDVGAAVGAGVEAASDADVFVGAAVLEAFTRSSAVLPQPASATVQARAAASIKEVNFFI